MPLSIWMGLAVAMTTGGAVGLAAGPAGAGPLTVVTYNVAGLPTSFGGEGELNNIHVSPLLNGYDLVALQEDFFFHDDLTSAVDYPFASEKDTSGVTGSGDGLLRLSESPFVDFQRITWVECFGTLTNASDCLTPKGFNVARHEIGPGTWLDVYNLHAEAGSAPEDLSARRAGLRQLADFIDVFSTDNAVLVLGDFNSRYTREGDILPEVLSRTGLHDTWIELVRGGDVPAVGEALTACALDGRAGADCEIVDKVLYRGSQTLELLPVEYRVPVEEFSDGMGVPLSDHDPVVVRFDVRAVPEPTTACLLALSAASALRARRRLRPRAS
jgi:hypothetical protein